MASFTDQPHIAFTPYIETNPVDAYLRVGMYKEQQLQEGIAKVQGYVDSITGLPIIKEEDKKYVQDKLNGLKNGITKNLSGDFSDSRITSQIAGGAKQIYTDPLIQNSVAGTMAVNKVKADIEQSKKDKTWNIANESVVMNKVNNWLSDGKTGSKYSDYFQGYTPYTDRKEMFLKYWKEVNPNDRLDIADYYYYDKKLITPENPDGRGINPVIFKGKSPAQIQAVWDLVNSDGNAKQQAEIDGAYQYMGASPEQMYTSLGANTKAFIDQNNKAILALQAKAAVGDPDARAQIEQLKELNLKTDKKLSEYAQGLQTNPDGVKASLVNEQMLHSLIGAYSSQTISKSDLWETSFQQSQANKQAQQWKLTYDQTVRMNDWTITKDTLELQLKEQKAKETKNKDVIAIPGAVDTDNAASLLNGDRAVEEANAAKGAYTQSVGRAVVALSNPITGPFTRNSLTGEYVLNFGKDKPYKTKQEAEDAADILIETAGDNYLNGTIKDPSTLNALKDMYDKFDISNAKQLIVKEVDQLVGQERNILQKNFSSPEFLKAYIVDKKLDGWKSVEKDLIAKYGKEWPKKLGIFPIGGEDGKNYVKYQSDVNKLSSPSNFKEFATSWSSFTKKREETYRSMTTIPVGWNVTEDVSKPENFKSINTQFAAIARTATSLNSASVKGDYNDFLALTTSENNKSFEANQYESYVDPITHEARLTIANGKSKASITIPEDVYYQQFPERRVNTMFEDKFGPKISLSRGRSTDYTGQGYASAIYAELPTGSPYTVKYHIDVSSAGRYKLRWWVGEQPKDGGKSVNMLINGETLNGKFGEIPMEMTQEDVISWTNKLNDPTWVNNIILLNKKLKEENK